jgi:hypothetical protein
VRIALKNIPICSMSRASPCRHYQPEAGNCSTTYQSRRWKQSLVMPHEK